MATTLSTRRIETPMSEVLSFNPDWTIADRRILIAVLASMESEIAGMHTVAGRPYIRVYDANDKALLYIKPGYMDQPNGAWWPFSTCRPRKK